MLSLISAFSLVNAQVITSDNTISPTSVNLNAVSIDSSNATSTSNATLLTQAAMAVGDGGVIIRWNGTRWSTMSSNTTMNLYSIMMINATNAWAVGGNLSSGVIMRYNGTWSVWNMSSPLNSTLYGVTAQSNGTSGWAVGANGINLYCDGANWTIMPNATRNTLRSVAMVHNSTNAWAVGDNGTIIMWNGTTNTWANMTSPSATNLNAIVMANSSVGWSVGGNATNTGLLMMLNATTWSIWNRISFGGAVNTTAGYVTDKVNATLYSLTMDNASSAWASGANGTVLYWTGTEWDGQVNAAAATNNLKGIAMIHGVPVGTSYAWAVGDGGKIIAWTGSSWIPEIPFVMVAPLLMSIATLAALLGKYKLKKRAN